MIKLCVWKLEICSVSQEKKKSSTLNGTRNLSPPLVNPAKKRNLAPCAHVICKVFSQNRPTAFENGNMITMTL